MSKICKKCGIKKPLNKFGAYSRSPDKKYSRCLLCEKIRNKNRSHSLSRRFSRYKTRAKKAELKFDISHDDFKEITSKQCSYCGKYSNSTSADFCGIDRLNSDLGYIKGNIVPCCKICNLMKGTLTYKAFIKKIVRIANYQKKTNGNTKAK